jgi:tRNA (guanine37-N1)-methyltransferase
MRIDCLTLFPEMFQGVFSASIVGKALEKGIVQFNAINFRDFSTNKHHTVDDAPYGGGSGMVLKPEPIFAAVESVVGDVRELSGDVALPPAGEAALGTRIILLCPQGERFNQAKARELSQASHLVLICGHYEGYDERIREHLVTDEISVGDFVMTGGEIPAMAVIDSVIRLLPGALGNEESALSDSYSDGLLEYPQYTRPAEFRGWAVPEVLRNGNHREIEQWRRRQSILRTAKRRPELLQDAVLSDKERNWLQEDIVPRSPHSS